MNSAPSAALNQKLIRVGENLFRSKSSDIYYAILKRNGKQIRKSLHTTDRELAKRRLDALRPRVANLATNTARSLPFAEYEPDHQTGDLKLSGGLAKQWLTVHVAGLKPKSRLMYENSIKMLAPHFRGLSVRNIGLKEVQDWAARRSGEVAARTFNADLLTLQQILDFAVEHGLLLDNPARRLKRRKLDRKPLFIPTRTQFRTLLQDMRSNDGKRDASDSADLVEFLAYSGCRISEIVGDDIDPSTPKPPMHWGDIDFKVGTFTVKDPKNHEARVVPLFPPLRRLLEHMCTRSSVVVKATDPLFRIKTAYRPLSTATDRLGLPQLGHHAFRHFFCSNAIESGVDFKAIAGWLGHKDGGVLVAKTYGHLRDEHSVAMAKRMTFDAQSPPSHRTRHNAQGRQPTQTTRI